MDTDLLHAEHLNFRIGDARVYVEIPKTNFQISLFYIFFYFFWAFFLQFLGLFEKFLKNTEQSQISLEQFLIFRKK